jgi:N utilization substance protein B
VTRRQARELALQTLFSIEIGKHEPSAALEEGLKAPSAAEQREFVSDLVLGTIEHASDTDAVIAPLLVGWTLDRLPTIDRLILRMAIYEMRYQPETPRAVVMNEAIELAKKYSTEDSGRFVNGVLSSASKVA